MNRVKYHRLLIGVCPRVRVVHDSKNRLDGAIQLAQKATKDGLHEILDITSSVEPFFLLCYHFRKYLLSVIRRKSELIEYHFSKCKYIFKNLKKLQYIRKQHKMIKSNWL